MPRFNDCNKNLIKKNKAIVLDKREREREKRWSRDFFGNRELDCSLIIFENKDEETCVVNNSKEHTKLSSGVREFLLYYP
jgi:hypothetical protein